VPERREGRRIASLSLVVYGFGWMSFIVVSQSLWRQKIPRWSFSQATTRQRGRFGGTIAHGEVKKVDHKKKREKRRKFKKKGQRRPSAPLNVHCLFGWNSMSIRIRQFSGDLLLKTNISDKHIRIGQLSGDLLLNTRKNNSFFNLGFQSC
jgi:hypothetical protein